VTLLAINGCAGGFYFNAFGYAIDNGGIDTKAHYPYIAQNGIPSLVQTNAKA